MARREKLFSLEHMPGMSSNVVVLSHLTHTPDRSMLQ